MGRILFFLLALMTTCFCGTAQELTNSELAISNTDKTQPELFNQLRGAKEDTNKVKLLIAICGFHWYNGRNMDSLAHYGEEARTLSLKLHFNPGLNEASYILCRRYLN